ncbi:translation initiation factor 2, alpha subunit [Pyrolobus fumarii 1A]|uniref:Translation initiation factor 2 subunit alpha n=1 Tax=Pyrolobus fumarii (strain DSM 11204 / 1A) TaxID=694429 RepID=G0EEU5_PYRF1|nr:translation initiation factor IF-2 subunit alpha [Pyrolobus fumarii]AEM38059.1 translation initiation factor 2, alpha subunit [Pyrolobus fumarii 1A]
MVRKRKELPEVGELVVGTVKKIYDYGAYLNLDEYGGIEAYLPWSEVASRWVRRIDEVIKEGQKVVVKVIRVHKQRKTVDVSLKRVTEGEKRRKMLEWKRAQKAEKILEIAAQRLGKTLDEAYEEAGWKIEEYYGELMAGLEQAAMRGPQALIEAGVPEEWAKVLAEEAARHIEIRKVRVAGLFTLRSLAPDGVERIKQVLLKAKEAALNTEKDVEARVYTVGAPRYRIEIIAVDYKKAEKALAAALETAESVARELGVEYSFTREKSK